MMMTNTPKLAVTDPVETGGDAVIVAMGGRLAVLCAAAAIDGGLQIVLIADAATAATRIRNKPARIVVVPGTLTQTERSEIASAVAGGHAALVELPRVVDEDEVAHRIARAVRQTSGDDPMPATQRSMVESARAAR